MTYRLRIDCTTTVLRRLGCGEIDIERWSCQCDFWFIRDFTFDTQVGSDLAIGRVFESRCRFVGWHTAAAKCGCGASEEDGGDVENDVVDQVVVEGFAEGASATFDEDMLNALLTEVFEDGGEWRVFVNDGAVAVFIREKVTVAWDLT